MNHKRRNLMKILLVYGNKASQLGETLFLAPALLFLKYTGRYSPSLCLLFAGCTLLMTGLWAPYGWPACGVFFLLCLSLSLLHHDIHRQKRAIVEGFQAEKSNGRLVYGRFFGLQLLLVSHVFLLVSLILLLRQAAILWGNLVFEPATLRFTDWGCYALDMVFKAVLFDIPEIYHIDLINIAHKGFWGSTMVFVSRLIILALIVGAILRWREVLGWVRDAVGILERYPQIAETRLLLLVRMYPRQLKRLCNWSQQQRFSLQARGMLLEILGKTENRAVLPVLEKSFQSPCVEISLAALKGMEQLKTGKPALLAPVLRHENSVPALREQVCHTLAAWGTPESIGLLAETAQTHRDTKTRLSAIVALGKSHSEGAIAPLSSIMLSGDASKEARFTSKDAILALGIFPKEFEQRLHENLSSPHPDNRRFAAMVLGGMAGQESFVALENAVVTEKDTDSRVHMIRALGNIAYRLGKQGTKPSDEIFWQETVARLKKLALTNEEVFVRVAAILSLVDCAWLISTQTVAGSEFTECLRALAAEEITQIADAANEALARLEPYVHELQFRQRRECITAVGFDDLAWRQKEPNPQPRIITTLSQDVVTPGEGKNWNSSVHPPLNGASGIPSTVPPPPVKPREITTSIHRVPSQGGAQGRKKAGYRTTTLVFASEAGIVPNLPDSLAGRYHIVSKLSLGKVSVVYRVVDAIDGQNKVLKYLVLCQDWARQVFAHEMKLLSNCQHASIIPILEKYETESAFTMPWIGAPTLYQAHNTQKCQKKLWSWESFFDVMKHLCEAVDALHKLGWCHGDLKPENILYLPDRVILLDFNSAYPIGESEKTTAAPILGGTPYYMAPEQIHRFTCNLRTDIYAIGVIGYEILTGFFPVGVAPVPVHSVRQDIDPQVHGVLVRATSFYAQDRYASVMEFWEALSKSVKI